MNNQIALGLMPVTPFLLWWKARAILVNEILPRADSRNSAKAGFRLSGRRLAPNKTAPAVSDPGPLPARDSRGDRGRGQLKNSIFPQRPNSRTRVVASGPRGLTPADLVCEGEGWNGRRGVE
jgi:hypothetical protein